MSSLNTAILFMVWRRPERTKEVMESIRRAKPNQLFVTSDGPRADVISDKDDINQVYQVIEDLLDWDVKVHWLKREKNLGCRDACSEAIAWTFEHVDRAIILEDDCLPSQSFYLFCDELLERFKHDKRIWQISGNNAMEKVDQTLAADYTFSNYGSVWGWATWRDRWQDYQALISKTELDKADVLYSKLYEDPDEAEFRMNDFKRITEDYDTWDTQWTYLKHQRGGFSAVSKKNMICNTGFGKDATHTFRKSDRRSMQALSELEFPLKHPDKIEIDQNRDRYFFQNFLKSKPRWRRMLDLACRVFS